MPDDERRRAAQYVRMSTEHQRYSIPFQSAANAAYALERGYEIVRTYDDAGISGLGLRRRFGLQQLLRDVVSGEAGYSAILVYDVSRWGRFQDTDESAHYEFLCRSAGVEVIYTAEPFDNDGSLASTLVKHLKRAMAAEFSRELSQRVSRAQRGLGAKGYWMGGPPAYGLVRQVVTPEGVLRVSLKPGERSAVRGDRVILAPGPDLEVRLVRRIFRLFTREGLSARQIAILLNGEGRAATYGARWSSIRVRGVLRNAAYVGVNVIGKVRHVLGARTPQPPSTWVRAPDAFRPVVSVATFEAARRRFRVNKPIVSETVLLAELTAALRRHGRLSRGIIDRDPETHCASVYQYRFGNLSTAYARVGYAMTAQQAATSAAAFRDKPHLKQGRPKKVPDDVVLAALAEVLAQHGYLSKELIGVTPGIPHSHALTRRFGGLAGLYERLGYQPNPRQLLGMRTGAARQRDLGP